MKKCYIAGKIGGLEIEVYTAKFNEAKDTVRQLGYEPVSPVDLHDNCTHEKTWLEYMRCDIKSLVDCDALYALDNWVTSPGAGIEVQLAKSLGLEVIYQRKLQSHYIS